MVEQAEVVAAFRNGGQDFLIGCFLHPRIRARHPRRLREVCFGVAPLRHSGRRCPHRLVRRYRRARHSGGRLAHRLRRCHRARRRLRRLAHISRRCCRHFLAELLECEILREGHPLHDQQLRPCRGCILLQVRRVALRLQQQYVRPHHRQNAQENQLMRRNRIAFIENAGRIVVAQEGHQALEFVVQPAHKLNICIFQHIFCFSIPPHGIQRIID